MPVRIVTDSTADIPPAVAKEFDITVVPLKVIFGQQEYRDGVDIDAETFYQRLTSSTDSPTTSQPSPGEFETAYRQAAADGSELVSIHISGHLSKTVNSARIAADIVKESGVTVHVVDSSFVTMALGMIVIRAARAARAGKSAAEIVAQAERDVANTRLLFAVDTLEYLRRGGRIGRAQALVGTLFNVKPLLTVQQGEVAAVERVRTRAKAIERLYEWAGEQKNVQDFTVLGSPPLGDVQVLADRVQKLYAGATFHSSILGPVVGTHTGPGIIGIGVVQG